jgi:phage-related protein
MVNVTISLVGSNGDTIVLADNSDFVLATGVTGFGIPSTAVRIDESAGDGGTWRHTKRGIRDLDLPIVVLGNTRADVETKLRRLARLLQTNNGATKIVANYSDGTSLFLEAHYVGGAETQFGSDATSTFCRWVVQMQAPQPYWQSGAASSFSVGSGNSGRGLLPELTKMRVSSSQTLGTVEVNNEGDVAIQPRWVIRGPIKNLVISNGTLSFGFTDEVLAGKTYTVDTATSEVFDEQGENIYYKLSAAPKLFPLEPGNSTITVTGIDASPDTQITCYYSPRYEVIH